MSYKKFSLISIALAFSLILSACASGLPRDVDALKPQGAGADADSITVYVISPYAMTEIVANSKSYNNWKELLDAEFDGRSPDRAPVVWRGDYVLSVGILQTDSASEIAIYFNGIYSDLFALNCPYEAGSVLAFVSRDVDFDSLKALMSRG